MENLSKEDGVTVKKQLAFGGETVRLFEKSSDASNDTDDDSKGSPLAVQVQPRRLSLVQSGKGMSLLEKERKKSTTPSKDEPEWYSDISEEQINMFKQVFELLDRDGDHTLDTDELYDLLSNLDVCPAKEEIRSVLLDLDSDGNGVIDFMEFLYAMANIDMLDVGEDEPDESSDKKPGESKYSKRQSLFFTAITKFAMKNSLSDVERYYNAKKSKAPHVIAHYTAGARVLGLTDRQIERHYAQMRESSKNAKSPYAKPLQFVTMKSNKKAKTKSDQIKVTIGKSKAPPCRGRRAAMNHEELTEELSTMQEQLLRLAENGSVLAKIPDVHLFKPIINKLASGELERELEQTKHRKQTHTDHGDDISKRHACTHPLQQKARRCSCAHSRAAAAAAATRQQRHVKKVGTRRKHKQSGWRIPVISSERSRVPLPSMDAADSGMTVEDLPKIRKKVASKLNDYYDKLRYNTVEQAWAHWNELHIDEFPSDYLKDNFRRVYQAYSPHTKKEAFVIAPWVPPPSPGRYGCWGELGRYGSANHKKAESSGRAAMSRPQTCHF